MSIFLLFSSCVCWYIGYVAYNGAKEYKVIYVPMVISFAMAVVYLLLSIYVATDRI